VLKNLLYMKIFLILMVSFFGLTHVQAADKMSGTEKFTFENIHTNILWLADHLGFSKSTGQFLDFSGEFMLNYDAPAESTVEITIQTASISTGLPNFDAHLKTADFFDVEKYPTATFKSTKVTLKTEKTAEVEGELTMLGKSKPLTLQVRFNKRGIDVYKNVPRAGFSVRTTVKRSLWGMEKYLPLVGDDVKLIIEAEGLAQ